MKRANNSSTTSSFLSKLLANRFGYLLIFAIFVLVWFRVASREPSYFHLGLDEQDLTIEGMHLNITTDMETKSFTGITTLDLFVHSPKTRFVKLHASKPSLEIKRVSLSNSSQPCNWAFLSDNVISIHLPSTQSTQGYFKIQIYYQANLNQGGFYLLENYHLVSFTNFEPIAARSVFPCIDLPSVKTRYTATFNVDSNFAVRFNTEPEYEAFVFGHTGSSRRRIVTFSETALLPSYLIAWYIYPEQDFHVHSSADMIHMHTSSIHTQIPVINILSTSSDPQVAILSLKVAIHCVEFYTEVRIFLNPTF